MFLPTRGRLPAVFTLLMTMRSYAPSSPAICAITSLRMRPRASGSRSRPTTSALLPSRAHGGSMMDRPVE